MIFLRYWPLLSLVLLSIAGGLALDFRDGFAFDYFDFMHGFMGIFLLIFSALKIFDISGFRVSFSRYDLLGGLFPFYGYVYPFLELFLALGYLSHIFPIFIYSMTFILFSFGSLGVLRALRLGLKMDCPCMGSILSVPLSVVTLSEDIAMSIMSLLLLWEHIF